MHIGVLALNTCTMNNLQLFSCTSQPSSLTDKTFCSINQAITLNQKKKGSAQHLNIVSDITHSKCMAALRQTKYSIAQLGWYCKWNDNRVGIGNMAEKTGIETTEKRGMQRHEVWSTECGSAVVKINLNWVKLTLQFLFLSHWHRKKIYFRLKTKIIHNYELSDCLARPPAPFRWFPWSFVCVATWPGLIEYQCSKRKHQSLLDIITVCFHAAAMYHKPLCMYGPGQAWQICAHFKAQYVGRVES